jgi:ATP-dependent Clp protease, protease subunit
MTAPAGAFPPWPGQPGRPRPPSWPAPLTPPGPPGQPRSPEPYPPAAPARVWLNPGTWPGSLYERLLEQRIVMAGGELDSEAATRLCAQLLTLDAEGDDPIRLELQGLSTDLPTALTVMGVLDVVGVPVHALVSGQLSGPALGVLAACGDRRAYPNAMFALAEPRTDLDGTATEVASGEEQFRLMLDALYTRLAEVTGREVDDIRSDARQRRLLTVDQAVSYGLLHGPATGGPAPGPGSPPR